MAQFEALPVYVEGMEKLDPFNLPREHGQGRIGVAIAQAGQSFGRGSEAEFQIETRQEFNDGINRVENNDAFDDDSKTPVDGQLASV